MDRLGWLIACQRLWAVSSALLVVFGAYRLLRAYQVSCRAYHAWLGDADASLEWIERSFEVSPRALDWRWVQLRLFDKIRADPTFQTRLQRIRETAWSRVSDNRDAELSR